MSGQPQQVSDLVQCDSVEIEDKGTVPCFPRLITVKVTLTDEFWVTVTGGKGMSRVAAVPIKGLARIAVDFMMMPEPANIEIGSCRPFVKLNVDVYHITPP
jgi:hypothetical protein